MSAFITLASVTCRAPDGRSLFENLDLAFGPERTGLVGRNGVGKTTLLRLLLGELEPATGAVARTGRVVLLRQAVQPPQGARVADLSGLREALDRLIRIEAGEGSETDFEQADWTLEARLRSALDDFGLGGVALDRPAASLSGGQAARVALAGVLAQEPDLILLDEPTNDLDADGREAVRALLAGWRRGAVVVSHDRTLLAGMDRIVELSTLGAEVFGGGWALYQARKAEQEAAAERALGEAERAVTQAARESQAARERQARRDAAGRRFAARASEPKMLLDFRAERAERSGGRVDRLADRRADQAAEALADARSRVERLRRLAFELPPTRLPLGRTVLAFEQVAYAHPGGPRVLDGLDWRMTGPERVAVTGANGAGKTTLLRLALGELQPDRGAVRLGVRAAFLDQRAALLRSEERLRDAYARLNPQADRNAAQAALATFLFRNTAAERRVGELSGGERLRAALACVLTGPAPPPLLVLDEPTNHLDLDSIRAVEAALRGYDGALLLVSHDEAFLEAIELTGRLELGGQPAGPVLRPA